MLEFLKNLYSKEKLSSQGLTSDSIDESHALAVVPLAQIDDNVAKLDISNFRKEEISTRYLSLLPPLGCLCNPLAPHLLKVYRREKVFKFLFVQQYEKKNEYESITGEGLKLYLCILAAIVLVTSIVLK